MTRGIVGAGDPLERRTVGGTRPRAYESVAAELAPEFDQLRRDVASWFSAIAPCLDCGHVRGMHDPEIVRCWGKVECPCRGMVTSTDRAADSSGVRPTDTPGAPPP